MHSDCECDVAIIKPEILNWNKYPGSETNGYPVPKDTGKSEH